MKLREERHRLAQGWLEEYSMRAAAAKLKGHNLNALRAEYIHRYNQLLDREKQPHCDFFLNLSFEVEEELDFEEERPFDLSEYDQHFVWDEAEYLKLRFIAARHYASRGHWDDAYAYVLRSRPGDTADHEDTYNRNAQAWHYTNARVNELIQEAERALEFRDRQIPPWSPRRPPEDSLIPSGRSVETTLPPSDMSQSTPRPKDLTIPVPKREQRIGESWGKSKTPLSPDRESQKEERKSAIDAVKQITGVRKEVSVSGGMSIEDTPEYDWDTRYDGVQGFASRLRNRVSEPSTPQRDQSPRERTQTPPRAQRTFKQLKVYDETPTGRPLPTLQQVRQANLRKIFEEEGAETPCDICGDPTHDYRRCTKEAYRESQDVRQDVGMAQDSGGQCPNCGQMHPGVCPCAWCDQLGHIAQDCLAHFADDSMQTKFPKKVKIKKTPIKYYECRRCGESHPFNIYCPNVRDPPVIPGECRSCGTITKEHANDCQYVAIKDNIGLCTYCRSLNHRYMDCPQRRADHERSMREKKKNKRNNRKKGRVKIVAGIMTREQDSDSTLLSEERRREGEILSPRRMQEQENLMDLHSGEVPREPMTPPRETICSFCGVATHGHRDCPLLHQYIRQQADALAEIRLNEYRRLQGWADYEPPQSASLKDGPLRRGGGPHEGGF